MIIVLWCWFFKKKVDVRREGGLKIRTHADEGGGGKNGQKFADFVYGWPLTSCIEICNNVVDNLGCDLTLRLITSFSLEKSAFHKSCLRQLLRLFGAWCFIKFNTD